MGFRTEFGHAPPMCTQFSIFLENRVGRLYDLAEVFDGQPTRIVAFSILEASDHAVVRLVTTHSEIARSVLSAGKLPYSESELLVVELAGDQRISHMCRVLLGAELNIFYAYSMLVHPQGATTVAVHCDDQVLAGQILERKGFKLVDEEELRKAAEGWG